MLNPRNHARVEVLTSINNPFDKFTLYKVIYNYIDKEDSYEITINKRFSEFKRLYDQMYTIHLSLCRTNPFPMFLKANFFDRFEDVVIESRRKVSEDLLKFICENKHLHNNKYFKDFINNGQRKSINSEVNVFDRRMESIDIEKSLPSPILPMSFSNYSPKSCEDYNSINFDDMKVNDEVHSLSFSDIHSDDNDIYLEHAFDLIKIAEEMELKSNWNFALKNYENAIEILLKAAKLDRNKTRVTLIHQQIKSYLDKAETIKNTHIKNDQITDEDTLLKLLGQCIVLKSSNNNEVMLKFRSEYLFNKHLITFYFLRLLKDRCPFYSFNYKCGHPLLERVCLLSTVKSNQILVNRRTGHINFVLIIHVATHMFLYAYYGPLSCRKHFLKRALKKTSLNY